MGFPIRVRQASPIELIFTLAIGLPACAVLIYMGADTLLRQMGSWFQMVGYGFLALEAVAILFIVRNFRRELVIDETSIRMLRDNAVLWELPWQRYGGYRIPSQGPVRTGIPVAVEFLDIEGKPVGKACLIKRDLRSDQFALMPTIKLLQDRIPEGGFCPQPEPEKRMKRNVPIYWSIAALGLILFVFGFMMMRSTEAHHVYRRHETPPFSPYLGVMILGSMLAGVFSGFAAMSPRRSFQALKPENLEGFMAVHSGSLSLDKLQPGRKYRYVDADALRDNLDGFRRHAILLLVMGCGIFVFPVYVLIDLWHSPYPFMFGLWAPIFSVFGLVASVIAFSSGRRLMACNKLRNSLEDQVVVSGDHLEVSRAGTVTTYPLAPKERKGPKLVLFGARYLLLESDHGNYWLDPRFLEEA